MLPPGANRPVFPQPLPERGQADNRHAEFRGIFLLDWLAAQALPVALASLQEVKRLPGGEQVTWNPTPEQMAEKSYDLAEAMLGERQKRLRSTTAATAQAADA